MSITTSRSAIAMRPLSRRLPCLNPQQRRTIYGYEQAKALIFKDHGEPKDVLSLHTHSISPPHSSLITLQTLAAPINPADINQIQGVYPSKPTFSTALSTSTPVAVPGNEGAFRVLSAGSAATRDFNLRAGDWVVMKAPGFGTWRTHAQGEAAKFVKLEEEDREGISAVQAATVSVNPCTAYAMLKGWIGGGHGGRTLKDGDWFVQNGANSGVGRAAIQLGKAWGLRSINIIRARPGENGEQETEKLKSELKELGADEVLTEDEAADKGFTGRVKELTGAKDGGVKLALNCVGGRSAFNLAKILAPVSHHVTYGAMAKQPLTIPAGILIFKDIRFAGFWVSRWSEVEPDEKKKAIKEVLNLTREGRFKDSPFNEVKWDWNTTEDVLKDAVEGGIAGFRGGKGVFVFEQ